MAITPLLEGHRSWRLAGRMVSAAPTLLIPLVGGTLFAGMAIYHFVERLDWSDAFLNASMLLGGMGPVNPLKTTLGKWLAGFYALFDGLVVIVIAGVMLAPMFHHILHKPQAELPRQALRPNDDESTDATLD